MATYVKCRKCGRMIGKLGLGKHYKKYHRDKIKINKLLEDYK